MPIKRIPILPAAHWCRSTRLGALFSRCGKRSIHWPTWLP